MGPRLPKRESKCSKESSKESSLGPQIASENSISEAITRGCGFQFNGNRCNMLMLQCQSLADERLRAVCLFFQDYTISDCGPCPGWLHFLPKMYQMCNATSLLHHAVCTAAYANLAQKTERRDLAIIAMSHYRESLEIVKKTLLLPKNAIDDSTMTGVALLGLYEIINSTLDGTSPYHHCTGLETLVCVL